MSLDWRILRHLQLFCSLPELWIIWIINKTRIYIKRIFWTWVLILNKIFIKNSFKKIVNYHFLTLFYTLRPYLSLLIINLIQKKRFHSRVSIHFIRNPLYHLTEIESLKGLIAWVALKWRGVWKTFNVFHNSTR